MSPARSVLWILAGLASLVAPMQAQNVAKKVLLGDTKVDVVAKYRGAPLPKPDKALVYDFNVPADAAAGSPEGVAREVQTSAPSAAAGVAAGGITDTAATVEADASRMAKGVAKQVADLMASQTWASPQQPPQPN